MMARGIFGQMNLRGDQRAHGMRRRAGRGVLAGRAVGAPFVGSVAACLAIAEFLRLLQAALCIN
jgi:hypothetical protein